MRLSRTDLRMLIREELNRFKRARLNESRTRRGGRRLSETNYGEGILSHEESGPGSRYTLVTILRTEDSEAREVLRGVQDLLHENGLSTKARFMDVWGGHGESEAMFAIELSDQNPESIELVRSFLNDEHIGPMY